MTVWNCKDCRGSLIGAIQRMTDFSGSAQTTWVAFDSSEFVPSCIRARV